MTVEHRAAAGLHDIEIELADDGPALRLVTQAPGQDPAPSLEKRVIQAIGEAGQPLSRAEIRTAARARNATVVDAIDKLARQGKIEPVSKGRWRLAQQSRGNTPGDLFPAHP